MLNFATFLLHSSEETRPSIEAYAAQFTKHFGAFYDRMCCSVCCCRRGTTHYPLCATEAKPCAMEEEDCGCDEGIDLPELLLKPYLQHPLQVQYHWHGRLVHSLATLCAAVRDYNQRDETLHLEAAYLRSETASVLRLGKHGCWSVYFNLRKSLHQRHEELWAARRQQLDQLHALHHALRDCNHDAMEYNLYLRSNGGLDQTRYVTRVGVYAVDFDKEQNIHEQTGEDTHVSRSYLTVRVAHPERDLVLPEDGGGVSYRMRVLTALTISDTLFVVNLL